MARWFVYGDMTKMVKSWENLNWFQFSRKIEKKEEIIQLPTIRGVSLLVEFLNYFGLFLDRCTISMTTFWTWIAGNENNENYILFLGK